MRKLVLASICGAIFCCGTFAQKKELSLAESVTLRQFGTEHQTGFSWVPNSDSYVYAESNWQVLKSASAKKTVSEQLATIQDANTALGAHLYNFAGFRWKNNREMILDDGKVFYLFNPWEKTGKQIAALSASAENANMHSESGRIAFTVVNNLHVLIDGKDIAITQNENTAVVSGQFIARNEFGIDGGIFWSPKGNLLAFYQKDQSQVHQYPLLNINETPGTLMPIYYPMAGQLSEKPKVGIYNVATGKTVFISPKGNADDYLTNLSWTPDEKYVVIAELNRDQDHMWLNAYDAVTGAFVRTLFEETSQKWVEPEHPAFFPGSGNDFIWISERDGFNNLYHYDFEGKLIRQLTANKFMTKEIISSLKDGKEILFKATGASPLNTMYYVVELNGNQRLLTLEEGTHTVHMNNTGTLFIDEYTSHVVPWKTVLKSANTKNLKVLYTGKSRMDEFVHGSAEIGQIKAADGSVLYTRLIKPSGFDPEKKYPVLVYVYGGPHAQMITNSWLDGASTWMYWMAEQGYLVFTLDNRGSGERGVAFESQIHRQLGTIEVEDQMSGVDYLKSLPYVDGDRLAVHGWSFGGFMTTTLMLKKAGTFNVGVAGGPVTDWKYYEVMYGERYMDRPEQNEKGYEEASVLNHADKLKGKLLLIHGTVDDVVVEQQDLALVKRFIELGIQMDFFPYPMHKHNVYGKDRIHLMTKVLNYIIENNHK